jgi:hypothetical protein
MGISMTIRKKFERNKEAMTTKGRRKGLKPLPLTPRQKLEVLIDARDLIKKGYTTGSWRTFVNGVESFCIYGALQKSCGVSSNFGGQHDMAVSACSLTDTLYKGVPEKSRIHTDESIKLWTERAEAETRRKKGESKPNWILGLKGIDAKDPIGYCFMQIANAKVSCLQGLNDSDDKKAVLAVFDKAIKRLRDQLRREAKRKEKKALATA